MPRKPKKPETSLTAVETGCLLIILMGVAIATGSVMVSVLVGIGYGIALGIGQ